MALFRLIWDSSMLATEVWSMFVSKTGIFDSSCVEPALNLQSTAIDAVDMV